MSPELRDFVEARWGRFRACAERGGRQGGTRVFRIDDLWLKVHTSPRKYLQERHAYTHVAPKLAAAGFLVPTLLDRVDDRRLLLLSHLDGQPALARSDREDLHRQAGELLQVLHGLDCDDTDPLPLEEALRRRMQRALAGARAHLPAATLARAEAAADELGAFRGVKRRWCHRDLEPSNWLVHGGRLGLVDFEHTRPDAALVDLVKLADGDWIERPSTRDAFFRGRPLDPAQARRLHLLLWLHGVATVAWASAHTAPQLLARGRRLLARLAAPSD